MARVARELTSSKFYDMSFQTLSRKPLLNCMYGVYVCMYMYKYAYVQIYAKRERGQSAIHIWLGKS